MCEGWDMGDYAPLSRACVSEESGRRGNIWKKRKWKEEKIFGKERMKRISLITYDERR